MAGNDVEEGLVPRLECRGPEGFSRDFALVDGTEVSVGRSPDCTMTEGGQALSRRHATVAYWDGLAIVEDLNSSNGTFLNGQEVTRPEVLLSGDTVMCGELAMTYYD